MHTDSEMTGISRLGSMHYMTAASLEMSDEPLFSMAKITNENNFYTGTTRVLYIVNPSLFFFKFLHSITTIQKLPSGGE